MSGLCSRNMDTPPNSNNDKCLTWRLPVSEDGVIELPDDLIEATGWQPGTPIYWYPQDDGSIIISDQHKEPKKDCVGCTSIRFIGEFQEDIASEDEDKLCSVSGEPGAE